MDFVCDGCQEPHRGRRVVFSTEATDDQGLDVEVAKRWVTCPACADDVFARIGRISPWDAADGRTLTYPDDVFADATHA
jgi:hypothetical protein